MKAKLSFQNFVVPKFLFEKITKKGPDSLQLTPRVVIDRKKNQFHVNFDIEIYRPSITLSIKIFAVGIFEYDKDIDEAIFSDFIAINGPAIVYPYIRSFISAMSSLSGFDTVTLPTVNLSGFADDIRKNLIEMEDLQDE